MTENKKPLVTEEASTAKAKNTNDKVSEKKVDTKKAASPQKATQAQSKGISKLAILALIIAIAAPAGHFYWQQQQTIQLSKQLSSKLSQENSDNYNHIQRALNKQQSSVSKQLQQIKEQINHASQEKIAKLTETVSQLAFRIKQRQPSDWLLHESEYLIRVAARTLWLEHDTAAAIGLLKDANARLTELNDPAFLPVRELIHQDIKSLEMMPILQTDEVILTLMAMSKQVTMLPLAMVDLAKEGIQEGDFELSDNINDWRSNLAKTWQKFLDDFIRVRQRAGTIEPLIAPEQQAHLKQNLTLKIQLALWAASERKGEIYQKTLTDIEQWLKEFFAMDNDYNQQFLKALTTLQQQQVSYDYSNELASLPAIRAVLNKAENEPVNNLPIHDATPEKTTLDEDNANKVNNETSNEDKL